MSTVTETVAGKIYEVFDSLKGNNFSKLGEPDKPMWESPLIGIASDDDSYYDFLKEHIGPFHWKSAEAFAFKYGEAPEDSKLRVISLVFPQTKETKQEQMQATVFPCNHWLVSRGEWEGLMREFTPKIERELERLGYRAVAIDSIREFSRHTSDNLGIASTWSHRHTAYAAGLGTFGLSDGFISERGKAIRLTSIIVEAPLDVTDRGDRGPYDWCLHFKNGTCGACTLRCPVGASK